MIWQRRRELERRLNDVPAVRLAALSVELGLLAGDLTDPAARNRLVRLQDDVRVALEELRDIGSELYPPPLVSDGIGPALLAFAERRGVAVAVHVHPGRFPARVEAELYFAIVDVLDAGPGDHRVSVTVGQDGAELVATIDGPRQAEIRVPHQPEDGS